MTDIEVFNGEAETIGNFRINPTRPDNFGNKQWFIDCNFDSTRYNSEVDINSLIFTKSPASKPGDYRGTLFTKDRSSMAYRCMQRGAMTSFSMGDLVLTYKNDKLVDPDEFESSIRGETFTHINFDYRYLPDGKYFIIAVLESMLASSILYKFETKADRDARRSNFSPRPAIPPAS